MMVNSVKANPSSNGSGGDGSTVAENGEPVATGNGLAESGGCGLFLFDLDGEGIGAVERASALSGEGRFPSESSGDCDECIAKDGRLQSREPFFQMGLNQ